MKKMIKANDPKLESWIEVPKNSDFPIQNLPFGIFKGENQKPCAASIIGKKVIDLNALAQLGYFDDLAFNKNTLDKPVLNPFIRQKRKVWRMVRERLSYLLNKENATLRDNPENQGKIFHDLKDVRMKLPVRIGDYTDFYASKEHATNVGTMFRDPKNALLPNWLHLPVGYHGRASSIIVSGTPIHRPKGQTRPDADKPPVFGPSKLLDFELEMGYILGQGKRLGKSISTEEADEYIFGLSLFNDWSARDIQKWEYVPLGPFLGKNFASSLSPWIVSLDALEPFRTQQPKAEVEVLPYLRNKGKNALDIKLEVQIKPEGGKAKTVCRSNFKHMYWTMQQQLAHHTVNGCNINAGDLLASGTISGKNPSSYGSMLELSWKGTIPIKMNDGSERKFLQDGDTVIMKGYAQKSGHVRIGLGEVRTKILPAT